MKTNAKKTIQYGIVGDGRLATHLKHYFLLEGLEVRQWARRTHGLTDLESVLSPCDVILLLISDRSIASFYCDHPFLKTKTVLHGSGSLICEGVYGFHFLSTFGTELYDLKTYRSLSVIHDDDGPAFDHVFPDLKNPHYFIPKGKKGLYHALCVLSGNFTTILWSKFFSDLENKLGLPRDVAYPYLAQISENLKNLSMPLTGPLVRRDLVTIQNNLAALKDDPYESVYEAVVNAYDPGMKKELDHALHS